MYMSKGEWYFGEWYFGQWYFDEWYFGEWHLDKWYFGEWYIGEWFFASGSLGIYYVIWEIPAPISNRMLQQFFHSLRASKSVD